ncbi:hypothetical protein C8F04DRAFT_1179427 [Mycena alexandri]|uniref:Ribonuclease H1 N-terminal domain-containing protein n=1 Tax=Mycena alexandri TaxID=1745969 RepID=A0AAD6X6T8_9AGAR|nr:hypothetical protein C8F04DRAFT_1179427 [Mycena alexandri]
MEHFDERNVLIYPADVSRQQIVPFYFNKGDLTLRDPERLDNYFEDVNPGGCSMCPKPHFQHAAFPGVSFTVVIACPHQSGPHNSLGRNKSIARLFPLELEHQTCRGNLLVFKHQNTSDATVVNRDLPVIDIVPDDIPYIDDLVRRWVSHRCIQAQKARLDAAASSLAHSSRQPTSPLTTMALRVIDLDELFATLDLEDLPGEPRVATPPRSRRPPSASASVGRPPPPYSPPSTPFQSTRSPPPPSSRPAASHQVPPTPVDITRSPTTRSPAARSRKPKAQAYTVFRGREIGVFDHWPQAERAVSGVRFAVHQGYPSRERALAAFNLAQLNGWTCRGDAWTETPVLSSDAPLPVTDETARAASQSILAREPHEPWYVVYAGVNPGIFPNLLITASNVHPLKIFTAYRTDYKTIIHHTNLPYKMSGRGG